jgi:predicted negative regulator of RcsB-dependent stress response
MAYDLEQQEQLSALEGWWKQWGAALLLGIALLLVAIAAYQGWAWYKRSQATEAADLYSSMLKAEGEGEPKQARDIAAKIAADYRSTGYASLAQLVSARLAFEAGDSAAAKQDLQWVDEHGRDDAMKSIARYRLAGVLLDDKQYDDALKLLDVKPDHPMANVYADLRGDVYLAKGSPAEARAAWQSALEKTAVGSPFRNLIQIKIDSLGKAK